MVAGGISQYGLSNLVFCSGTMNKFSYKQFLLFLKKDMDNLKEKYSLNKDLIFQKDNASCHKSKETLEAIEVIFGENKIWWPANSPDLSPIETVWAILKQELSKKNNSSLNELREHVLDIWCRFPVELCQKIVSEFDSKIRICQKEEGKIIWRFLKKILSLHSHWCYGRAVRHRSAKPATAVRFRLAPPLEVDSSELTSFFYHLFRRSPL